MKIFILFPVIYVAFSLYAGFTENHRIHQGLVDACRFYGGELDVEATRMSSTTAVCTPKDTLETKK